MSYIIVYRRPKHDDWRNWERVPLLPRWYLPEWYLYVNTLCNSLLFRLHFNKRAVLSQGNRAMQRVFPTPNNGSDCYLLQKGQGRCSTGCHLLTKSVQTAWDLIIWLWGKFVTRCQILILKCNHFDFGCGSARDPETTLGELTALPQTL